LETVEARLGEPSSRLTVANETILAYGPWRLVIEDGRLTRRIRSRHVDQAAVSILSDHQSKVLDQKILGLKRGTSIASVRRMLGTPEDDEDVFEEVAHPEVILGYGAWELKFQDGVLKVRTKF